MWGFNRYLHMKQQTLAMAADQDSGFEQPRKPTRREEFLQAMDAIVPWAALCHPIRFQTLENIWITTAERPLK